MNFKLLLLFSILVFFGCTETPKINDSTIAQINMLLDKNIEMQQNRFFAIERKMKDDMSEPRKYKYRFLIHAAYKAMAAYEVFNEEFQLKVDSFNLFYSNSGLEYREDFLKKSIGQLEEIDIAMIHTFDSLLNKEYKVIGLREREVKERIEGVQEEHSNLQASLMPEISKDVIRNDVFKLKLKSLKYAAVHKAHFFIEMFSELTEGQIICDLNFSFPLVHTKKNSIKKGEYFEASIFVGSMYDFHPLENPKIIVNGDTLDFDVDVGFANYKFKATERGEQKLKLEFQMFNHLTREVFSTGSEYVIYVE